MSDNLKFLFCGLVLIGLVSPSVSIAEFQKGNTPVAGVEKFSNPDQSLRKIIETLKENSIDSEFTEEDFYRFAAEGIIRGLNETRRVKAAPARMVGPEEFKYLNGANSPQEIVGIGVALSFDPKTGLGRVDEIIPGMAAEKGEIQIGDRILKIDGVPFQGKTVDEMVQQIRGEEGSVVTLTLIRGSREVVKSLVRKRMNVQKNEVTSHIFDGRIGYLQVENFFEDTPMKVRAVFETFLNTKIQGLVIDLRKCGGGNLSRVIEVLGYLLPAETTVCQVVQRDSSILIHKTQGAPLLPHLPISVLIDKRTSSGAEIFVAALQESINVRVIGEPTEGWSDLQSVEVLPNGFAFFYTSGQLKTGKGRDFQGKGIQPDIQQKSSLSF